jgi:ABC-type branched-subunit amino acid transport system ATPase component
MAPVPFAPGADNRGLHRVNRVVHAHRMTTVPILRSRAGWTRIRCATTQQVRQPCNTDLFISGSRIARAAAEKPLESLLMRHGTRRAPLQAAKRTAQQQQLAIARALVSQPKVLLLDEPTEGIQPSIIKDIAKSLNVIRQTWGITIIVTEQVLSFALDLADRFYVIESGRLVREDQRADVNETKIKKYLAV